MVFRPVYVTPGMLGNPIPDCGSGGTKTLRHLLKEVGHHV
jgi:hypothetical protein